MIEIVAGSMIAWTVISKALGNGGAMREALKNSQKAYQSELDHQADIVKIKNSLRVNNHENEV